MISFNPSNDADLKWYQYRVYTQSQIVQNGITYTPINENVYFLEGYSVSNVFTVDVQDNSTATPNYDGSVTTNNVVYYAKVRSVDTSGNVSAWTSIVSSAATPLIQSSHIANLTAGKITSGTINAAEITLNGATSILKSSNYVQGNSGWKITGFGDAEFNNLTIRTALDIGGNDSTSFHVDVDGNMWSGAGVSNYATAPFRVSNAGVFRAGSNSQYVSFDGTNLTLSGSLSAASGTFTGRLEVGGVQLGNDVGPVTGHYGLSLSSTDFNNIFLRRSDGVYFFRVGNGGSNSLTWDSSSGVLNVTGNINATSGTFSGTVTSGGVHLGVMVPGSGYYRGINLSPDSNTQFQSCFIRGGGGEVFLRADNGSQWIKFENGTVDIKGNNITINSAGADFTGTLSGATGYVDGNFRVGLASIDGITRLKSMSSTSSSSSYSFVAEKLNGENIIAARGDGYVSMAYIPITGSSSYTVYRDGGFLYLNTSSRKVKENIKYYNNSVLNIIKKFKPATFTYKRDQADNDFSYGLKQLDVVFGLIVEDVEDIQPELGVNLVTYDSANLNKFNSLTDTKPYSKEEDFDDIEPKMYRESSLIALCIKAIQELSAKVEELESRLV